MLDILQSVPILGFLSITVTGFIALFPGRLLGVECAAIFAIFTSQAWNMTFSVYQSLRTVPLELIEAARMYHLSPWRRFWRLEVPHAIPSLVWNMMMSVSGGWFFVVASEAITVSGQSILLPGVGSYIATAIAQRSLAAIGWAVLVMLVVILLYDQLLFRPLIAWSRKFQGDPPADAENVRPWFLIVLQRARMFDLVQAGLLAVNRMIDGAIAVLSRRRPPPERQPRPAFERAFDIAFLALAAAAAVWIVAFIRESVDPGEIGWVFLLGMATATRVLILIGIASLIWVPIGVWIGLRPRVADRAEPIVQFLAAFPANLFFPAAVVLILRFRLDPEIWLSPLMILGTQWYILFNVIAGTTALPVELRLAAQNLAVRRLLWWRRRDAAGDLSGLCDGCRHRSRRIVECEHRRRDRPMGRHDADRDRDRRLYRAHHRRGRRRAHRARDRRPVPLCARLQPSALAPALQPRRRAPAPRLAPRLLRSLQ